MFAKMKKRFLLLSMVFMVIANVQAHKDLWKVWNIASWPLKPFQVLDPNDSSIDCEYKKVMTEISGQMSDLEATFKDDKKEYCTTFHPKHRKRWKYRHFKDRVLKWESENASSEEKWKCVNEWKYGPLCDNGQLITKCLHTKLHAHVFSGIWYVALAVGTAQGIHKVRKYFKRKDRRKLKRTKTEGSILE